MIGQTPEYLKLSHLSPCDESVEWILGHKTWAPQKLWEQCRRPDWMLWLLFRKVERKDYIRAVCKIVECDYDISLQEKEWKKDFKKLKNWNGGIILTDYPYLQNAARPTRLMEVSTAYFGVSRTKMCEIIRQIFPKVPL